MVGATSNNLIPVTSCGVTLPPSDPNSPQIPAQLTNQPNERAQVACVTSLWEGTYQRQTRTFLTIQRCTPDDDVHPVYGMRVIEKAVSESLININVGAYLLGLHPSIVSLAHRADGWNPFEFTGYPMCAQCAA